MLSPGGVFGTAVPTFLLWQANRLLNSPEPSSLGLSTADRHKQLLIKVFAERGEMTPFTAALQTPLTLDGAAGLLLPLNAWQTVRWHVRAGYLLGGGGGP